MIWEEWRLWGCVLPIIGGMKMSLLMVSLACVVTMVALHGYSFLCHWCSWFHENIGHYDYAFLSHLLVSQRIGQLMKIQLVLLSSTFRVICTMTSKPKALNYRNTTIQPSWLDYYYLPLTLSIPTNKLTVAKPRVSASFKNSSIASSW